MSKYTKKDIIRMVDEEDVEFIRLQFTDIFGTLKNVAITASQLEKALNNQCMFDGSAIEGFVRIEESDMYLYPDLDTFTIFPWRPQQGKVARIICDVYRPDEKPFEGDPRYILKKVVKEAADMGYTFNVGPECEFFLFHTDDDGQPTTISHEKAGYFDLGPVDLGENARRDMVLTLEDMGFEIEASHHEVAPAQHEIDFKYDEALITADNIMTFKLTVKTIAKRHGLFASFMPKPKTGIAGSGMHVNMSLFKDGKNAFVDEKDELGLSKEAYYFIGGIIKHMKGMTAITNPLVNSYKRMVPGYEAPIFIAWSATNRSPLIRIPASRGESTRVELVLCCAVRMVPAILILYWQAALLPVWMEFVIKLSRLLVYSRMSLTWAKQKEKDLGLNPCLLIWRKLLRNWKRMRLSKMFWENILQRNILKQKERTGTLTVPR